MTLPELVRRLDAGQQFADVLQLIAAAARVDAQHAQSLAFLLLQAVPAAAQIKIGAVSCISGPLSTFGVSSIRGARMAIEEINGKGGVLGQSIELVVDDNG